MEQQAQMILSDFKEHVDKALKHLSEHLMGIRTGHASPALVDTIKVEAYGSVAPLNQLAHISVPEPRQLLVKPFDPSIVKDVEKAILKSDLGLMPSSDGKMLRLTLPHLSEEQRGKLAAKVKEIAESSRVAIRNARRDANKHADQAKKASQLTEDQKHDLHHQVQEDLKAAEVRIDLVLERKTREIMDE